MHRILPELRIKAVITHLYKQHYRLVTRSTISDTKGNTTTTTLLVTILLPCTETVLDVRKYPVQSLSLVEGMP